MQAILPMCKIITVAHIEATFCGWPIFPRLKFHAYVKKTKELLIMVPDVSSMGSMD